ncbi:MAG TPA: hypothetical protein VH186_29820 [Chloroflexia bacterium]|nr:hypothetical protein [Chloroflexia bacterium]
MPRADKHPDSFDEEVLAQLAAAATDRETTPPPDPLPVNGFWRFVDLAGPYSAYAAAFLVLVAFLVSLIGGPDFAWISFLSIPVVLLFVLYLVYLLRRRRQERISQYLESLQAQEQARLELTRHILEQNKKQQ